MGTESAKKHPPTAEQVETIVFSEKLVSYKISAYAGAGKTTTLTKISEHLFSMFNLRGLYLAFNKTIADEAKTKLHESVDCRTFHSLAYRSVGHALTSKVKYKRQFPKELASYYGAQDLMIPVNREEFDKYIKFNQKHSQTNVQSKQEGYHNLTAEMQMQCVNNTITAFCRSTDTHIMRKHVSLPEWASKDDTDETVDSIVGLILHYAKLRWEELINTNNRIGISHDIYLKVWALSKPIIEADYILFDEAQDADAVQLQILNAQKCPIIYVGDSYQSIYEWRGAMNAMSSLNIPELHLTQSFRFGTEIALYANKLLSLLGSTLPLRGHSPIQSIVNSTGTSSLPDAILCRSNKGAFSELIEAIRLNDGRKYAIQSNTDEIISFLENAKKLRDGDKTDHIELDNFDSWDILLEYAELNPQDQNVSGLVRIINEFEDIPLLLSTLKNSTNVTNADCVICTAHKSKGLEWDSVKISNDFNLSLIQGEDLAANIENLCNRFDQQTPLKEVFTEIKSCITEMSDAELRLLYVATTRGKKEVDVSNIKELYDAYDYAISTFFARMDEDVDLKAELA